VKHDRGPTAALLWWLVLAFILSAALLYAVAAYG